MFGLLLHEHEYKSSEVTKKLYHKIFASEAEGLEAATKLARVEAVKLNRCSARNGDNIEKYISVDEQYVLDGMEDFDAAVLFVDGKDGIYSVNDATISPVISYKVVQFVNPEHYNSGMGLVR